MYMDSMPKTQALAVQPRLSRPLVAWLAVNLFDAVLTYVLLGLGGVEGNPALAKLQSVLGAEGMLTAKVGLAAAVGLALTMRERSHLLVLASRLMGLVVVYNAIVLAYYLLPSMGVPFTF